MSLSHTFLLFHIPRVNLSMNITRSDRTCFGTRLSTVCHPTSSQQIYSAAFVQRRIDVAVKVSRIEASIAWQDHVVRVPKCVCAYAYNRVRSNGARGRGELRLQVAERTYLYFNQKNFSIEQERSKLLLKRFVWGKSGGCIDSVK